MSTATTTTTKTLIDKVLTRKVESFMRSIPCDWENLDMEKEEILRKDVSEAVLEVFYESEENDSEEVACGRNIPKRGGVFNTNLEDLNEIVRRLDKITEEKKYHGTFERCENVQLIVKMCSFISARTVALMYGGKSYDSPTGDDDDEDVESDSESEDLYQRDATGSPLSEGKCVEKILKWFRRIGREDADRTEELCGYVQLYTSPDVEDEFITFKDVFLMSLFGVDLYDDGDDGGEVVDGEYEETEDDADDEDFDEQNT